MRAIDRLFLFTIALGACGCESVGAPSDASRPDSGLTRLDSSIADGGASDGGLERPDAYLPPCADGTARVGAACLAIETPRFDFEVVGWNLDRAYPGIEYRTRIAVRGGEYPYRFVLRGAPDGMTIDDYGRIAWTPPAGAPAVRATVEVIDALGVMLSHELSIAVTTDGFYFLSPDGDDGADGSIDRPWRTLASALTRGLEPSDALYFRAGTYSVLASLGGSGSPLVWMGYPGEHVVLDAGGMVGVGVHSGEDRRALFQGIEFRHAAEKMFWMGGPTHHLVFRENVMHDISSSGANNPAFLFFEDDDYRPVEGRIQYDDIVVQDNVFYDLRNDSNHGAALIAYNVSHLLFEDNEVHDIVGRCVGDKDDGYRNVFRHNHCHHVAGGIRLENQYTQAEIEVSHNLFHDVDDAVTIGWQPGWIRDVWVHHNTIVGAPIVLRWALNEEGSDDIHIYRNLIVNSGAAAIAADEPAADDALEAGRVHCDGNLYWTQGAEVYSARWGQRRLSFSQWQSLGHDPAGVSADPMLEGTALPPASPYLGTYGRLDP